MKTPREILKAWNRMHRRGELPGQRPRAVRCRCAGCLNTRPPDTKFCSDECERIHLANRPE